MFPKQSVNPLLRCSPVFRSRTAPEKYPPILVTITLNLPILFSDEEDSHCDGEGKKNQENDGKKYKECIGKTNSLNCKYGGCRGEGITSTKGCRGGSRGIAIIIDDIQKL